MKPGRGWDHGAGLKIAAVLRVVVSQPEGVRAPTASRPGPPWRTQRVQPGLRNVGGWWWLGVDCFPQDSKTLEENTQSIPRRLPPVPINENTAAERDDK